MGRESGDVFWAEMGRAPGLCVGIREMGLAGRSEARRPLVCV